MTVLIDVISEPSRILEIEGVWNALISKCGKNPLFLSGFVKQFMEFYRSKGWTPLVLVISADKMVVGIAPLMTKKKVGVRFVKFLSKSWFSPDFIVDDQYREPCITSTLDFLFKNLRCQFVDLTLPVESPNLRILKQKCKANRIYCYTKRGRWADMGHCIIPTGYTWAELRSSRGKNFRRKFKKIERHLDRAGSWKIIHVENGKKESGAIRKILDVERMSWKEAVRTRRGIETDQDLLMIWKGSQHMTRTEPDFKWSVCFLELNNQTLAYSLALQYKEAAFIVKTSYDKRYKKFYPGIYVNNAAIRELFNKRRIRKIDLLTDLPFHRTWTSRSLPRVKVMISRKSVLPTIMGFMFASAYAHADPLLKKAPFISDLE